MKDEIVTSIILIFMIVFFVYNSYAIEHRSKLLGNAIQKAVDAAFDEKSAKEEFAKVKKMWEKEKKLLFYISGHSIIMQIDENIELGCEYIDIGDEQKAVFIFKKAEILLKDLAEREKFRLDNIF